MVTEGVIRYPVGVNVRLIECNNTRGRVEDGVAGLASVADDFGDLGTELECALDKSRLALLRHARDEDGG